MADPAAALPGKDHNILHGFPDLHTVLPESDIQGISENTVLGHHGVGIFWNIQDWEIVQE